ncbi:hypothetical protein [Hymenobacter lapidiphilus]|uniref:Uncharacterized protein n=1 Tax=Hymenobacter lapidiphilus TaxID=2608003 RepID=A0A7Y7U752_9BACT|nr:hypothetical protein [Hymenobacter lapidiphilus]NVO33208.1 hypothetical protein [Hymenobacter lapidiphilus]
MASGGFYVAFERVKEKKEVAAQHAAKGLVGFGTALAGLVEQIEPVGIELGQPLG